MEAHQQQFTERERDVIQLLLSGNTNKQMALRLDVSSRAIEKHLTRIYEKLEVSSRSEAIVKLIQMY